MELFIIFKYLFSLSARFKSVFGLFLSPGMRFIRKKLKDNCVEDFSVQDLLSLLAGEDPSVYYSKATNEKIEQVLGVEIRFSEEIHVDPDKIVVKLVRKLGELAKEGR